MIDCFLERIHHVNHTSPVLINTCIHDYDELTYYIYGNGTTQICDSIYSYGKNTFAFYRAGHPHNEDNHESSNIIYLRFMCRVDNMLLNEGVFNDRNEILLRILRKLRNISEDKSRYSAALTECCLTEAVITAAELQESNKKAENSIDWKQVLNYINENGNTQIDFNELSRKYNYSYSRFRHLFCEKFGVSPNSYLIRHRIESAKMMMSSSSYNLTAIAYDCGFSSSSQFSNIFKKYTGILPSEYKEDCKSKD